MKKSKFLIYAALAAAAVAISSCSDNDVLDSTTKAKGNALIVNASLNDGSRIATTGSDGFNSFMLYGYTNPTSGTPTSLFDVTGDGIAYQKTSGTWGLVDANLASKAVWPSSSGGTYNFYALSVDGSASLPSYTGVSLTNINQGQFVYTGKSDLSKQEDILVASSLGTVKPAGGILTLPFKHALSKVTMQLRFNSYENGQTTGNITDDYHFTIKSIILHNVALNGIYDYTSGWTASDRGNIVFEFPEAIDIKAQHLTGTDNIFINLINEANSILVVPQSFTADNIWTSDGVKGHTHTALSTKPNASYIEVKGWLWDELGTREGMINDVGLDPAEVNTILSTYTNPSMYDVDDDTEITSEGHTQFDILGMYTMPVVDEDTLGPGSVYYPIPAGFTFEPNKMYNIRLNIYKAYKSDGEYVTSAAGQV